MLVNNGFNEEAEGNLEYLCKYFPEDAELHYNLGIVYEKLKKFEKDSRYRQYRAYLREIRPFGRRLFLA